LWIDQTTDLSFTSPHHQINGMRYAVIDIGSNSVKMLVAERIEPSLPGDPISWKTVDTIGVQTRLAQGLYQTGRMSEERIGVTLNVIRSFCEQANHLNAQKPFAFATSAVREAANQEEFAELLHRELGLELKVIDGTTEAEWVHSGVNQHPFINKNSGAWMILDVGGGSSECIWGHSNRTAPDFSKSYPIGTVRLLEALKLDQDPPWPEIKKAQRYVGDFIRSNIEADLKPFLKKDHPGYGGAQPAPTLILTSGAAHILTSMEGLRIAGNQKNETPNEGVFPTTFTEEGLFRWLTRLWKSPLEERRLIPGMIPDRADVMLMGILLFHEMLSSLRFQKAWVSSTGLRHGALNYAFGN
jgi:exopolyphosphatase / guanosine-5'-triphosphate,3'-diphosphate pyrophosphatase